MRLAVNGQVRQDAYCREMIHGRPRHAHRAGVDARPARRRPDRHGHAGGLRARAPGKLAMFIARHLLSEAASGGCSSRKGRANPAYLRPGDRISASIRTDDGAIDLGEQTP